MASVSIQGWIFFFLLSLKLLSATTKKNKVKYANRPKLHSTYAE